MLNLPAQVEIGIHQLRQFCHISLKQRSPATARQQEELADAINSVNQMYQ